MEEKTIRSLPLEEAIQRLEQTAEKMENEELSLEQMMKLYKDGTQLARHCEKLLDKADQELTILEQEMETDAGEL